MLEIRVPYRWWVLLYCIIRHFCLTIAVMSGRGPAILIGGSHYQGGWSDYLSIFVDCKR